MTDVIKAVVTMGGIGLVAGILIAVSSKLLYVAPDERIKQIFDMLPHFNCGACGTPGCQAMAEELVDGNIKIEKCRPCTPEQREAIKVKMKELNID